MDWERLRNLPRQTVPGRPDTRAPHRVACNDVPGTFLLRQRYVVQNMEGNECQNSARTRFSTAG